MAMDLLGGLIGMNSYCNMCATQFCHHTMQGMAAQQQMSNQLAQHYNQLLGMAPRPQDVHRVADVIDKKTESNKQKLLLLLR